MDPVKGVLGRVLWPLDGILAGVSEIPQCEPVKV